MNFRRGLALFSVLAASWWGTAHSAFAVSLTPDQLADLSAQTSQRVVEIKEARLIALRYGGKLALYGGTTRELMNYVRENVDRMGSVAAYRKWLKSGPEIRLLDWHKIQSDLDFLLIPRETSEDSESEAESAGRLRQLREVLDRQFPGSVFYKKFDIHLASEFFERYPVQKEDFEAISNIPLTEEGVEELPELVAKTSKGKINLAHWGLEQLAKKKLEFEMSPQSDLNAFESFKQTLRWIRYASENPDFDLAGAEAAVRKRLAKALKGHRAEIVSMLKSGDESLEGTTEANSPPEKLVDLLEKLQLYSKHSVQTRKLLDDFGITAFAQDAGIAERRILVPLPDKVSGKGARLGREVVLYHRTSLSAAQNMSSGALWISNNESVIRGSLTSAAHGDGLYAAGETEALGYGDMYVQLTLSPDAVEGRDFTTSGPYYVIKSREAFARNSDGSPKISKVTMATLQKNFIEKVIREAKTPKKREPSRRRTMRRSRGSGDGTESVFRGLGSVMSPHLYATEAGDFAQVLAAARKLGYADEFLNTYFSRDNVAFSILGQQTGPSKALFKPLVTFLLDPAHSATLVFTLADSPELVMKNPELRQAVLKGLKEDADLATILKLVQSPYMQENYWKETMALALSSNSVRGGEHEEEGGGGDSRGGRRRSSGETDQLVAAMEVTPKIRELLQTAWKERLEGSVPELLDEFVRHHPAEVLAAVPEMPLGLNGEVEVEKGRIIALDVHGDPDPKWQGFADRVTRGPFDRKDETFIRAMMRGKNEFWHLTLLSGLPETRRIAVEELLAAAVKRGRARWNYESYFSGLEKQSRLANETIYEALKSPGAARELFAAEFARTADPRHFDDFPWNLKDPRDVAILQSVTERYYSDADPVREMLRAAGITPARESVRSCVAGQLHSLAHDR